MAATLFLIPAAAQDRRIAIYDFDSRNADMTLRGTVGQITNLGHQAAEAIMTRLVNSGSRFEVIERADIERILKEQGRKYDERFDPASAPELGRLLNVDGIVLGEVTSATASVQGNAMRLPGTKTTLGGKSARAKVHISARLISTQTGSIQVAQAADGEGNVGINSSLTGVSQGGTADPRPALADSVTKAVEKACANVSTAIIDKAASLPKIVHPGAPPVSSSGGVAGGAAPAGDRVPIVNSVDGAKVYIEGGQDLKMAVGDRYDVRQVTKVLQMSDGRKQEVLERVETVVIDDVQGSLSIAHVEGAKASHAKTGDKLQKATGMPPILQGGAGSLPPALQPPPPGTQRKGPGQKFLPGGGVR